MLQRPNGEHVSCPQMEGNQLCVKVGARSWDSDAGKEIGGVRVGIEVVECAARVSQDILGIWVLQRRNEVRTQRDYIK